MIIIKNLIYSTLITFLFALNQNLNAQTVRYSPAWFGPNANPVPEMTDARIPEKTSISLMGDYYFGFGDKTTNGYVKIEIPLLPTRVSMKVWTSVLENYEVTSEISEKRGMNGNLTGRANGDIYVQTRISIFCEKKNTPAVILNSTLKTASGTKFEQRRYFDTPGYYFDIEGGKSFYTKSSFFNEIRLVGNLGFLCWETSGNRQNDAPMYGIKFITGNEKWKFENNLSGYWGWMHTNAKYGSDYGDAPLVFAGKLTLMHGYMDYFLQYQNGINDFPYHQIRAGICFPVEKLTPKY